MRISIVTVCLFVMFACTKPHSVQVGGRFDMQDSVIRMLVNDREYTFPLDDKKFFSGKIGLDRPTYATLVPYGVNLFLSPGEDLEITVNAKDIYGALQFRGTLGAINNYLHEREMDDIKFSVFSLEEKEFVEEMQKLIHEKTLLLEAKNFGETFSTLEKDRIKYIVAAWASCYPNIHARDSAQGNYLPGSVYDDFISSFSLDRGDLINTPDFCRYVLNYIYYKGRGMDIRTLINYILEHVRNLKVRNYLLAEVIGDYVCAKGLKDSDYLLAICWKQITDTTKIARIERLMDRWRRLSAGATAPDFKMFNQKGELFSLSSFAGDYIYIYVWATWSVSTQKIFEDLHHLQEKFAGKNIRFLALSLDDIQFKENWEKFIKTNRVSGEQFIVQNGSEFYSQYMTFMLPRFLLIDPMGKIINVSAPSPDSVELLFKTLDFQ